MSGGRGRGGRRRRRRRAVGGASLRNLRADARARVVEAAERRTGVGVLPRRRGRVRVRRRYRPLGAVSQPTRARAALPDADRAQPLDRNGQSISRHLLSESIQF